MAEQSGVKKGGISVQIEHIFPIIKRWLYSEKEIFLREIVSNACDAVTKLRRLISLGEAKGIEEDFRIDVKIDTENKTLTVSDNGIGMTEEELRKYICQIALSGALDFVEKYGSEEGDAAKDGIIGHFGLGFYSAFMVSDTVEVITRSYTGAPAVKWVCGEDGNYEITTDYDKEGRGTDIVMHISESEGEYLNEAKIRAVLDKYCAFMSTPIYFDCGCAEHAQDKATPMNDVHPLWQKNPSDCTDEEYSAFYKKVFHDYEDPLFWIHINADYPLNFRGILYFPKIKSQYDNLEGQIKLYYNQVFVADNIKEVIPEFLLMLKGVLDCPELPLNVSRSYLQNSSYVSKIQAHIVKKVADKLLSLFRTEREKYGRIWKDIKAFVEYGCLRERKFYDRVKDAVVFETVGENASAVTLSEYLDAAKEKHEGKVYYTNDTVAQAGYIRMFRDAGISVIILDGILDTQYISFVESMEESVHFVRVDSGLDDAMKDGDSEAIADLETLFREVSGNKDLKVNFEKLKDDKTPAVIMLDEQARRFSDMMKMYAAAGAGEMPSAPNSVNLIVNTASPLISALEKNSDTAQKQKIAKQIWNLALLSQRRLNASELQSFLTDSYSLLLELFSETTV